MTLNLMKKRKLRESFGIKKTMVNVENIIKKEKAFNEIKKIVEEHDPYEIKKIVEEHDPYEIDMTFRLIEEVINEYKKEK